MADPLTPEAAAREAAAIRARLKWIEDTYGPGGQPRDVADVRALTAEQMADQLATPEGRAAVQRSLAGGRDVSRLDLRDPKVLASLSTEESAAAWASGQLAEAMKPKEGAK